MVMRKGLFIVAILAVLIASQSLAGGNYSKKQIRVIEPQIEINSEADQSAKHTYPAREVQIIEKKVEAPRVKASDGFATGLHYGYPVLAYKSGDYDFEIGYKDYKGDRMGLLRSGYVIWQRPETWTYIKNGLAYFPGNSPEFGVYIELENYITPSVAISGTIYPLRITIGGGQTIVNDATVGARAYW